MRSGRVRQEGQGVRRAFYGYGPATGAPGFRRGCEKKVAFARLLLIGLIHEKILENS